MQKFQVSYNKALKLTNACIRHLTDDDFTDLEKVVFQMEEYIKSKGAIPIGPVIQCAFINTDAELKMEMDLIRQSSNYIYKLEPPYQMKPVLRCKNCLYVRYHGDEEHLSFAYDKLNLIAFEEDIPLTGRFYTVFTSQNQDDFSADVFMEKAEVL